MTQLSEYLSNQSGDAAPVQHDGPYINCNDLFKIYKRADLEVVALRGLDLTVEPGELIAIIGASGSGKSTLLNILAGLDRPSAGQVMVGSRDLLDVSDNGLVMYRRSEVGFVWQATARNLVPYLTVVDNIELPMALTGQPAKARRAWSSELLESLGIADKAKRLPYQLSGGEQQRVSIARALVTGPEVVFADEPTGELDTATARSIAETLGEVAASRRATVIVATHDLDLAATAQRRLGLVDGAIVF